MRKRNMLDHLNIKAPVWNAGMGLGLAGPNLVAAINSAGGFGVLGTGAMPASEVKKMIDSTRQLTEKPIGANIIIPMSDGTDLSACFDVGVEVVVLFWGDIQPFIKDAQKRGIYIVSQCGSIEEAVIAADAGANAIIIQGTEAGGHVKADKPLHDVLKTCARELGSIPTIAAGGIGHGRDILKALESGAQAVSMGTKFLATTESSAAAAYKEKLMSAETSDTVITTLFDGGWPKANHRVIINGSYKRWIDSGSPASGHRPGEGSEIGNFPIGDSLIPLTRYTTYPPTIAFDGDIEEMPLYAGTSVSQVHKIVSVADLMHSLSEEHKKALLEKNNRFV
jgi:NAD(P)H-dependent flavin oxidoreductase YrpB (nitropropane dioxygenase family)